MKFININYSMREAVKWPKDDHKQCFRNSKMGKNIYGLKHQFPSSSTCTPRGTCWAIQGYVKNNQ